MIDSLIMKLADFNLIVLYFSYNSMPDKRQISLSFVELNKSDES